MMKRFLLFVLFATAISGLSYSQTNFSINSVRQVKHPKLDEQFSDYQTMTLDHQEFYQHFLANEGIINFGLQIDQRAPMQLSVAPFELRSADYQLQLQVEDGRVTRGETTRTGVHRGSVANADGSMGEAVFTFDENFVLGRWDEGDVTYFLEPLWRFVRDADPALYVVYRAEDAIIPEDFCGTDTEVSEQFFGPAHLKEAIKQQDNDQEKIVGECLITEIALASDFELFVDLGSSETAVENFMFNNLANVQTNYDDEFADEILFEVVTTFIATCNNTSCDPWTNSTNAGTLLNSFQSWGQGGGFGGVTYDVATLWTGRNFNGGTIGVAWLSGLCTNLRYNTCENFSSSSQLLRVLWSHELGHNFGSGHDASGTWIMSPSVNTATQWSAQSQNAINNLIASAGCLSSCGVSEPPTAFIEASTDEACTGSFIAFFDDSEGNVLDRFWEFPGGIPSTSTDPHPIVFFPAFLTVENTQGDDFASFDFEVDLNDGFRKTIDYSNFELGFDSWSIDNPDGDITWARREVDGNLGDFAAFMDNFDYNENGEVDALIAGFDFSAEADIMFEMEYAYARFNAGARDQLRITLSTDGGNSFPNILFFGDETGGGNFATAGDSNSEFVPSGPGEWCDAGPGCISLDLSAYAGQPNVVIRIENINGFGNSMYVDNIAITAGCGAVEPPIANFSQDREIGCAPLVVAFDDLSTGVVTDWDWSFPGGDPEFSTEQNPFSEYNTPGVYDVSLTVSNNIGSDTYTVPGAVTVLGLPTADFSYTNVGLTYDFTDLSTGDATDWAWTFGDGGFSFEQNPTYMYTEAGTYVVELEVFNECGSETTSQTIVVEPLLRADFVSTLTEGCAPLEVKFIDLSEGEPTSWQWSFPGGTPTSSDEQNPYVLYEEPGVYDVTLVVMADGMTDEITMESMIIINGPPTAGFDVAIDPGEGTPVITNTSTGADTYAWDFGNGEMSDQENPSVTYTEAGEYTISLTVTNECGSSTTTQTIEVVFPVEPSFTVSDESGCAPFTTTFTAAPQADGLIYEWSFPGGSPDSSTDPMPEVTYNVAGSYDVILTITNAAGSASVEETAIVTVNEGPSAAFNVSSTPGSLTVDLTDLSANADNVTWDFGDGNMANDNPTSYTYAEEGTYTITLTAENECGTDVATQEVTLILPVTPSINVSSMDGCTPLTAEFSASPQVEGQTYEWSFPGGEPSTSSDPNPVVVYNTPGVYDVTLTITNAAGPGTTTETDMISVGQGLAAAFVADNTPGSADVTTTNNSSFADDYEWFFGDGASSTETAPSHTYAGEGSYEIMLVANNECGTDTARQTVEIIFVPDPSISTSTTGGCGPLTVVYEAEPQGDSYTYAWDFPGGSPSTSDQQTVSVTYTDAGTYAASLTVTNAAGSATTSTTEDIEVLGAPTVGFTADYTVGENSATFTSTSTNVTTHSWAFGDGETGSGPEVTHIYAAAGTYEVTLTVTGPCGEETMSQMITVVLPPAGGFTAGNVNGCAPFDVSFMANDQGEGHTYEWSFPGGTPATSTDPNPVVSYTTAGTYDVGLTVTNAAGSVTSTEEGMVTVGETPAASIDMETTLGSLTIGVEGPMGPGIDSWSWNFGDGNEGSGQTASHTYAEAGTYTVELTTTNECGTNTATMEVTVLTAPTGTFTATDLSICPGETIMLIADETEGVTYSWDIPGGDPSSSTEAMVMVSFATPGSYDVSLSTTNAAGTTTTQQTVVVNTTPTAGFTFTTNGLTASFTNTSTNATTYGWQFPGSDSDEENPEFTFPGVGSYEVTLTASNECGESSQTLTVVIEGEIPSVNFTAENNEGCGPLTVSFFSVTEGADGLSWSFPGGTPSTSTEADPVVTYDEPGEYTVTLTATNAFGSNAITQENIVVVFAPIVADFTYDLDVTTATFNPNVTGATSMTWTFPDGSTSEEMNPMYTFPGNGTYTVTLTAVGPCNESTVTQEIVIDGALPMVNVDIDQTSGCAPFTVTYTDMSTNDPSGWEWSFPGGTPATASGQTVIVTYDTPGTYSATVEVSNAFGTTTMEMTDVIEVQGVPGTPDFTSSSDDDITFNFEVTDPNPDWTYTWTFGDGSTGEGSMVSHTYTENGTYPVVLTVTNDCGMDTNSGEVTAILTSTDTPAWAFDLRLSPNPTPGQLFISAEAWPTSGSLEYRLVNALGQEMTNGLWAVGAGNWRQSVDMSRLPAGTYWLQLGWDNERWTQKVIKQ